MADIKYATICGMCKRCPLCQHDLEKNSEEWEFSKGERYIRCDYCDLIFLDPVQRPTPVEERERYLEHNNSPEDEGYKAYLDGFAAEALSPVLSPPAEILDFGSGPEPVFASVLRDLGYGVAIYDPFFAPSKEWAAGRFDAVCMVEVAEHLFEPLMQFKRLCTVVRQEGYLVLRTLLHYSDKSRFNSWWYRKDVTHVCFYSKRSFEVLAKLLNLELVDIIKGRSVILRKR